MNIITQTVDNYLPVRRRKQPNGWVSFNCPVCQHLGHRPDSKQRGGILFHGDGYSFHCFNCKYTTTWEPGSYFTKKNTDLFNYLNVPKEIIGKCKLYAMGSDFEEHIDEPKEQRIYSLPTGQRKILDLVSENFQNYWFMQVLEYIGIRNINYLDWNDLYWSPDKTNNMNKRFIIPVYVNGNVVGYNARGIDNIQPKYIAQVHKDYIYNGDTLYHDRKYCIITEGVMDAFSIDATASMSNEITTKQLEQYNNSKQIKILLPDKDNAGKNMMEIAIDNNWWVQYPSWDCKDVDEAVKKYGRIPQLQHILQNVEKTNFKIRLKSKKYFKE